MKNKKTVMAVILIAVLTVSAFAQQGGKSINSADELKKFLDSQPANSPDKPIKIAMKLNEPMFPKVKDAINEAGKYVSLDLSGSPITTIPREAFSDFDKEVGCKLLVGIIIPNGITTIGSASFYHCTNLASVTISDSVTNIRSYAFSGCTSLISITIPDSVTFIGEGAFNDCTSLTSVTFQGTIKEISRGGKIERRNGLTTLVRDSDSSFDGDLVDKYLKGRVGTYTTTAPVGKNSKWTKK